MQANPLMVCKQIPRAASSRAVVITATCLCLCACDGALPGSLGVPIANPDINVETGDVDVNVEQEAEQTVDVDQSVTITIQEAMKSGKIGWVGKHCERRSCQCLQLGRQAGRLPAPRRRIMSAKPSTLGVCLRRFPLVSLSRPAQLSLDRKVFPVLAPS